MKNISLILLIIILFGCKVQQLPFKSASLEKGISGLEGGIETYTFSLLSDANEKTFETFSKLWYNEICYTISKQKISKEKNGIKVILHTQNPPKGLRSSKSPILLSGQVKLVIEHVKNGKVKYFAVGEVLIDKITSYPTTPPK